MVSIFDEACTKDRLLRAASRLQVVLLIPCIFSDGAIIMDSLVGDMDVVYETEI